jgi:hypothetical protein
MNFFRAINESAKYGHEGNSAEIYSLGEIDIVDEKNGMDIIKVKAGDIIRVVNSAMLYMQKKYPYLHLFIQSCKIMYVPIYNSKICSGVFSSQSPPLISFKSSAISMGSSNKFAIGCAV